MRIHHTAAALRFAPVLLAGEPESPWAAMAFGEEVPPATLDEARAGRSTLARLLGRERSAAADFLLALADFDRRRGWERLGHASLFAFLTRELGLSAGAAQLRLSAARLLPRHPAVEAALRSGQLCISAVGQLARVLTTGNEAEVLPRFLGLSAREAAEIAAELLPRADAPRREVVTLLAASDVAPAVPPLARAASTMASAPPASAACSAPEPLHTYEVHVRVEPRTPEVEPLNADLRRLHLTVSKGFLVKVAAARTGLSHALPGANTEQVLEAALDLLLERQARRKALVRRPRRSQDAPCAPSPQPSPPPACGGEGAETMSLATATTLTPPPTATSTSTLTPTSTAPRRPHIPARVAREVRLRDQDRCQFPLDAGGICGSTWQVELDHVIPIALGGATTADNLRCLCRQHNRRAARAELGEIVVREVWRRG